MRTSTLNEWTAPRASHDILLKWLVCVGALVVFFERVWIMQDLPLWLDETWSAMIATQPDWSSFWREAWLDCNPPLYYIVLKSWVSLAGDSNLALRIPSLVFTTGAAVAAFRFSPGSLPTSGRWTWAALLMFWLHSLTASVDARGYGLLLLLSVLTCVVFARLYERLTLRLAGAWVALCSLMFLTHYYAATLIAAQGMFLIFRHRSAVSKVWPAAALGLPALLWFFFHLPRLREYARPDVAWYDPLAVGNGVGNLLYVLGNPAAVFVLLVLLILISGFVMAPEPETLEARTESDGLRATALSGALGLVLAFAVGAVTTTLTARYLVPLIPPVMLGLVLLALRSNRPSLTCLLLTAAYLTTSLNFIQLKDFAESRNNYGYEKGSAFLADFRPTHLIFAWDHPAAKILDRRSLRGIGGFFLNRSGLDVPTSALVLKAHDDPNRRFLDTATGERPAIIWLFNTFRESAALRHPPTLDSDPAWLCRRYIGTNPRGALGAIVCVRKDSNHV